MALGVEEGEWLMIIRTLFISFGAHQAKASSSQAHQATQVLHTLSIKRGVHQATQVLRTLFINSGAHQATQVLRKLIKLRKFLIDDYSKKLGEMFGGLELFEYLLIR